jgi:hypothetical protein
MATIAVPKPKAIIQHVLDCLSEGDFDEAKDHDVPRLASGGGGG